MHADEVESVPTRTFVTLGGGELFSRLLGFAGTIYVARQLGVEMYGVLGLGFAVLMYATILADGGLEHTGPREVVHAKDALPALVSSMLVARTLAALLFAVIQVAAAAIFVEGVERSVLALYSLALLPVGLNLRWVHLGLERASVVSVARILGEATKLAIILGFVRSPSHVLLVPVAQVAGDAIAAAVLLWSLPGRGLAPWRQFDAALALGVLRRAFPMLASASLAMVIYNSDLIFLRAFRGAAEVGRYLAAYTLLNFLGILGHMVAISLTPAFTRLRAAPERRLALFQTSLVGVFAAGLPIAVGAACTAPLIIDLFFGPAYHSAAAVLAVLIWCLPVLLYRSVLQAALVSSERSGDVLRTTTVAALVSVGLNFVFVPLLGMIGAAITTVVAEIIRSVLAQAYIRRAGFAPAGVIRYMRAIGSALAMVAALMFIRPVTVWTAVILAGLTYVLAFAIMGGVQIRRDGVRLSV